MIRFRVGDLAVNLYNGERSSGGQSRSSGIKGSAAFYDTSWYCENGVKGLANSYKKIFVSKRREQILISDIDPILAKK